MKYKCKGEKSNDELMKRGAMLSQDVGVPPNLNTKTAVPLIFHGDLAQSNTI